MDDVNNMCLLQHLLSFIDLFLVLTKFSVSYKTFLKISLPRYFLIKLSTSYGVIEHGGAKLNYAIQNWPLACVCLQYNYLALKY